MPNITIQVSHELYQHARRAASNRNLSVSALLRNFLTTLDQAPSENRNDSDFFHQCFPQKPQTNMSMELQRLAREMAMRR